MLRKKEIGLRQAEGIAIAKAKGKHLGRTKAEVPKEFEKVYNEWKSGDMSAIEAMRKLNFAKTTFYKVVKKYESR